MPKKIPKDKVRYVKSRRDKVARDAGVARYGSHISFDLSYHKHWEEFKKYDGCHGVYKGVDFYCSPYFDDGYINCEIDSDIYWEVKAYVLAFYVSEYTKKRRDVVHKHMKETIKLADKRSK